MNPAALELRRMQMISEVGAENNSTTVIMIPSDFVSLAHTLDDSSCSGNGRQNRGNDPDQRIEIGAMSARAADDPAPPPANAAPPRLLPPPHVAWRPTAGVEASVFATGSVAGILQRNVS